MKTDSANGVCEWLYRECTVTFPYATYLMQVTFLKIFDILRKEVSALGDRYSTV